MDISDVPFVDHNSIVIDETGTLSLPFGKAVQNHMAGVHAGAQFLLAESASGYYLLTQFPEFVGRITTLLRESDIKFCKQAKGNLTSRVVISDIDAAKLLKSLHARGRAVIEVLVEIVDEMGEMTCSGHFRWFVQVIEQD